MALNDIFNPPWPDVHVILRNQEDTRAVRTVGFTELNFFGPPAPIIMSYGYNELGYLESLRAKGFNPDAKARLIRGVLKHDLTALEGKVRIIFKISFATSVTDLIWRAFLDSLQNL